MHWTTTYPKISVLAQKLHPPASNMFIFQTPFDHGHFHSKSGTQERSFLFLDRSWWDSVCRCTLDRYLHTPNLIKIGQDLAAQGNFQIYYINCYDVPFHYYEKMTNLDIWVEFSKFLVMTSQFFLHGWLEGLQGFHLERVWAHKNIYFLVRKCLDFGKKFLKKTQVHFSLIW